MRSTGCHSGVLTVFSYFLIITVHYVWLHCALASCGERAGGRCPNLTTASARSVCVSLSVFFIIVVFLCDVSGL